jgi:predicted glutamine amidotransferase
MCLITIMPPVVKCTTEFNYDWLKNASVHNSDGCGVSYIKNLSTKPELVTMKGLFKLNTFVKLLKKTRSEIIDSYFLIHQRAASKGNITYQNCHPFHINKNLSFAHNGTFADLFHKEKSDTFLFSEMLKDLPDGWQDKEVYYKLISRYAGGNKLAFLFLNNHVTVTNISSWIKENEYLFSNEYYKEPQKNVKNVCCMCGKYGIYFKEDKYYCYHCNPSPPWLHNNGVHTDINKKIMHCKLCDHVLFGAHEEEKGICYFCEKKQKKGN